MADKNETAEAIRELVEELREIRHILTSGLLGGSSGSYGKEIAPLERLALGVEGVAEQVGSVSNAIMDATADG